MAERNHHLVVEDSFVVTLEDTINKKVAEVMELTQIRIEEERERAIEMVTVKYLTSDAF